MKKCLYSLATLTLLSSAHAQFFGGWADGVTSMPTSKTASLTRLAYDDFTFDLAGSINGFGIVGRNNTGSPVAIYWEIRTGMSAGNGGTLLFSGTSPGATISPLAENSIFGTPPSGPGQFALYEGAPLVPFSVPAGTYWLGLAPLEVFGSFDVTSTQGAGSIGHPINNGNAFYYDSSNPSANYISMGANDFGFKITTSAPTSVVPEPGTLALLGLAALSLLRLRRK